MWDGSACNSALLTGVAAFITYPALSTSGLAHASMRAGRHSTSICICEGRGATSRLCLRGGFTILDACTAATIKLLSYMAEATWPATACRSDGLCFLFLPNDCRSSASSLAARACRDTATLISSLVNGAQGGVWSE